jgi:hypothetical protein
VDFPDYAGALELLRQKRPALKGRIADDTGASKFPKVSGVDCRAMEEVLGLDPKTLKTFEETVLDTVDSILILEKVWTDKGFEVKLPEVSPI